MLKLSTPPWHTKTAHQDMYKLNRCRIAAMNNPLLKLTNYLSNIKRKLTRGVVTDKMQEELSSVMDSECNLRLSYITGQPYPCRKRHEISYHYVITIKS